MGIGRVFIIRRGRIIRILWSLRSVRGGFEIRYIVGYIEAYTVL